MSAPKLIHMMFFPWGKDQKLIADQNDFDHQPFERMKRYAPDFEVMLWDYYATEKLCLAHYPEIWRVANEQPRPMMLVNTLRWLMVYHHGGISWQYDMNPLVPMAEFLPVGEKTCRVYTEFEQDEEGRRVKIHEPIRQGEPEEAVRIPSQVFAATPRHRYMKAVVDFIHERSKTYTFKRDYDCQFMTGNAAASTAYDLFGKNDPTVERIGLAETRRMVKFIAQGTWRTEEAVAGSRLRQGYGGQARLKVEGEESSWFLVLSSSLKRGIRQRCSWFLVLSSSLKRGIRQRCSWFLVFSSSLKRGIKRLPGYYWVRPHGHEIAVRELRLKVEGLRLKDSAYTKPTADKEALRLQVEGEEDSRNPNNRMSAEASAGAESRSICYASDFVAQAVADLVHDRGFRSVLNYPATHLPGLGERLGEGIRYIAGDPVRGTERAKWMNVMFSRVPKVECIILRNFFDHIGPEEAMTVIRRLREAGVEWMISTDYPCLNTNWNNYAGEWRPLNLAMKPYELEREGWSARDEDPGRRTDRELGLFRL